MSSIQIYSEAHQLILVIDGVRCILNLSAAEQLKIALSQTIPLLKDEISNYKGFNSIIFESYKKSKGLWSTGNPAHLDMAFDCLERGEPQQALSGLLSFYSPSVAWAALANIFYLHPDCRAEITKKTKKSYLSLSTLASAAPKNSALSLMWEAHAWDHFLLLEVSYIEPEKIPEVLYERLLHLLLAVQVLPSGRFIMGSEGVDAWAFEGPPHEVMLSKAVAIGRYPVTQWLYWYAMGNNPSLSIGSSLPVEQLSWVEACQFCNALSHKLGLKAVYQIEDNATVHWDPSVDGFRLPTEAEWEYGAHGSQNHRFSGSDSVDEVGWHQGNANERLQCVGQKSPNGFGLYDMSGNVWEWCWDGYNQDFYSHTAAGWDPVGDLTCSEHVCRGGSFKDGPSNLRVTLRGRFDILTAWNALGMRIVRQYSTQVEPEEVVQGQK